VYVSCTFRDRFNTVREKEAESFVFWSCDPHPDVDGLTAWFAAGMKVPCPAGWAVASGTFDLSSAVRALSPGNPALSVQKAEQLVRDTATAPSDEHFCYRKTQDVAAAGHCTLGFDMRLCPEVTATALHDALSYGTRLSLSYLRCLEDRFPTAAEALTTLLRATDEVASHAKEHVTPDMVRTVVAHVVPLVACLSGGYTKLDMQLGDRFARVSHELVAILKTLSSTANSADRTATTAVLAEIERGIATGKKEIEELGADIVSYRCRSSKSRAEAARQALAQPIPCQQCPDFGHLPPAFVEKADGTHHDA
jgi:hypothetical protein